MSRWKFALIALLIAPMMAAARTGNIPAPTIQDRNPGDDGGSSDDALDYSFRKQPVYFRNDYAPGTIVVLRPKRSIR